MAEILPETENYLILKNIHLRNETTEATGRLDIEGVGQIIRSDFLLVEDAKVKVITTQGKDGKTRSWELEEQGGSMGEQYAEFTGPKDDTITLKGQSFGEVHFKLIYF